MLRTIAENWFPAVALATAVAVAAIRERQRRALAAETAPPSDDALEHRIDRQGVAIADLLRDMARVKAELGLHGPAQTEPPAMVRTILRVMPVVQQVACAEAQRHAGEVAEQLQQTRKEMGLDGPSYDGIGHVEFDFRPAGAKGGAG